MTNATPLAGVTFPNPLSCSGVLLTSSRNPARSVRIVFTGVRLYVENGTLGPEREDRGDSINRVWDEVLGQNKTIQKNKQTVVMKKSKKKEELTDE